MPSLDHPMAQNMKKDKEEERTITLMYYETGYMFADVFARALPTKKQMKYIKEMDSNLPLHTWVSCKC